MSDDTKQALIKYKRECYKVLFTHFFGDMRKQIEMNKAEIDLLKEINELIEKRGEIAENIKKEKENTRKSKRGAT